MTIEDLALIFTPGIGSRGAAYLIDYFGSAEALFAASRGELVEGAGLREELAGRILNRDGMSLAEREIKYCRQNSICAIAATDAEYPEPLRETSDRPHVLFVRGNVDALSMRTLSMVGTREVSPSGLHACDVLVGDLAAKVEGLCVVSGLAYGVDSACHRAAIHHNVPTVAVVANVLPEVTPSAHRALADDIIKHGGAIVSELHSASRQNGKLFIARNRIIAGMSMGLVVVESPASGGALATADIADSYGRQVMAVPGRISDKSSFGTNNLIRTGKARLVITADDIIEDMDWQPIVARGEDDAASANSPFAELEPAERAVYDAVSSGVSREWSELLELSGLTIGEFSMALLNLEMKGLIRSLPGRRYEAV